LLGGAAAVVVLAATPQPALAGRPDVASLQVALKAMSLYGGDIDGISGPLTRRGVRRFQRRKRLTVDAIVGPRTRRALGRRGRPSLGRRAMKKGSRGWDVAGLQYLLRIRGFEAGGIDGGFGPNTLAAVRRFQSAAGLSVDGIAGPSTLRALRRRSVSRSRTGPGGPSGPVRFLRPVPGAMGDGFGPRAGGRMHTGIDFPMPMGAKVGAAGVGVVVSAGWNSGGYGNLVVVRHRLGFETWYAHLSAIAVSEGEAVTGGTRIGSVGSTGRSTGPHLHFEVRLYGTPIDPLPRLLSTVAARATAASAARRRRGGRGRCRPNADAWNSRDTDPPYARFGRCP
jgi:hypothetical protein